MRYTRDLFKPFLVPPIQSIATILLFFSPLLMTGQTMSVVHPSSDVTMLTETLYLDSIIVQTSDHDGVTFTLVNGPSDFLIHPTTGEMRWIPSKAGMYDIDVRITHGVNTDVTLDYTVKATVVNRENRSGCASPDRWLSLGMTLPGAAFGASEMDGKLYVFHTNDDQYYVDPSTRHIQQVSIWDGSSWSTLWSGPREGSGGAAPVAFGEELFLVGFEHGRAPMINGISSGLFRWNDTEFVAVEELRSFWIGATQVFDGEFYVVAYRSLNRSGGNSVPSDYRLVKYSNGTWSQVATSRAEERAFHDLAVLDGRLYLSCDSGSVGDEKATLVEVRGSQLLPVSNDPGRGARAIVTHQEALILDYEHADSLLHRWTPENGLSPLPLLPRQGTLPRMFESGAERYVDRILSHGEDLYVVLETFLNGRSSEHWRLSSGVWEQLPALSQRRFFGMTAYGNQVIVLGDIGHSCNNEISPAARLCDQEECTRVTGVIYHDDNGNCVQDVEEPGLEGQIVRFEPGGYLASTSSEGVYNAPLPVGQYEVSHVLERYWYATCNLSRSVDNSTGRGTGIDLGADLVPGITDVRVNLITSLARPGRPLDCIITYENVGTEPASGYVVLTHDELLTLGTTNRPADRVLPGRIEWDFSGLPRGGRERLWATFEVPTTSIRGDTLCVASDIFLENQQRDLIYHDDRDSACVEVRASHDPNDIRVTPHYEDDEVEFSRLRSDDTTLTYWVRFQNTGNDTAFRVVVRDTLSPDLYDLGRLKTLAASHPYTFSIAGRGAMAWEFDEILLPDSTTDEQGSHGYFKFKVRVRDQLPEGTPLYNQVGIYFDHNMPVFTNRVLSVTAGSASVVDGRGARSGASISPNPATERSQIGLRIESAAHVIITILDRRGTEMGRVLNEPKERGDHTIELPISHLSSGLYFVSVEVNGVSESLPLVVRR